MATYPARVLTQRTELTALLAVGIAPFYLNGLYNAPLAATNLSAFWLVETITWIVMPTVLLLAGLRRGLFTTTELGLTTNVCGTRRIGLLVTLLVAVPIAVWLVSVSSAVLAYAKLPAGWAGPSFAYNQVIPPRGPYRLLTLAYLTITAGVVEELYYRAAMDRLFPRGWTAGTVYILISSLIFAGAHWEGGLPNLVEAFAVGILAATVFRLTGNVWPLIVGHAVTDWFWFTRNPPPG